MTYIMMIFTFLVGFAFGWIFKRKVVDIEEEIEAKTAHIEEIESLTINVSVEEHDGLIYIYHFENSLFICRAPTPEEVLKAFDERYPDSYVRVMAGEDEAIKKIQDYINSLPEEDE